MSAPRKIWAARPSLDRHFSARSFSDPDLSAHLYHHDDWVRELVEALEAIWEICCEPAETDAASVKGWDEVRARAALAKIAQEG